MTPHAAALTAGYLLSRGVPSSRIRDLAASCPELAADLLPVAEVMAARETPARRRLKVVR